MHSGELWRPLKSTAKRLLDVSRPLWKHTNAGLCYISFLLLVVCQDGFAWEISRKDYNGAQYSLCTATGRWNITYKCVCTQCWEGTRVIILEYCTRVLFMSTRKEYLFCESTRYSNTCFKYRYSSTCIKKLYLNIN